MGPDANTAERIHELVASKPVEWRRVDRGYTVAERWVAKLENGTSVFIKKATDEDTTGWLCAEQRAYESLDGDFLPRVIGWDEAPDPILILEDLSTEFWPPPWSTSGLESVLQLLERLASTKSPEHFPSLAADPTVFMGWHDVAKDRSSFLELGLVSPQWLDRALPVLMKAEAGVRLAGDALVHGDVRSDNICLLANRTVLVDWNGASRGNPKFDLIAWLPSLHAEGGPAPWDITTSEPELIAAVAGYFAYRAWQPPLKQGPAVRHLQ